jgi:hypothetical protein
MKSARLPKLGVLLLLAFGGLSTDVSAECDWEGTCDGIRWDCILYCASHGGMESFYCASMNGCAVHSTCWCSGS